MRQVLDETTRLSQVLRRLAEMSEGELTVVVPEDSIFASFPVNIEFIKSTALKLGKVVRVVQPNQEVGEDASVGQNSPVSSMAEAEARIPPAPTVQPEAKPKTKRKFSFSPRKLLATFFVFILLTAGGASAFVYYYLPRATVTLVVDERVLERSAMVEVTPGAQEIDYAQGIIPGRLIKADSQLSKTFKSTGQKEVGDKATGTVEVRNFSESSLALGVGTVLSVTSADGNLVFYTNSAVTVPRVTITNPSGGTKVFEAGTVTVAVTASEIGTKYNIAADKILSVEGFAIDDVSATNVQPFKGGSTRQVTVVSTDDQRIALEQLRTEMFAGSKGKLTELLQPGEAFDERVIDNASKFATYSHEIGAEVDEFTLTLAVNAQVVVYKEADVKDYLKHDLGENIPEGFELSRESETLKIEQVDSSGNGLSMKAKVTTLVIPQVNISGVREQLIGKKVVDGEAYLRQLDKVEGYDVELWPILPEMLRTFPHLADRIVITVQIKGNEVQSN